MARRFFIFLTLVLGACSRPEPKPAAEAPVVRAATPAHLTDSRPVIVCFGDSLTAGFGLDAGLSYPDFLQKLLDARGFHYRVVNLGISGDTTSGGLERIDSATALKPAVVILELGANDGLRGLPVETTRSNLDAMIHGFQNAGAKVLLAGITLPRNYGAEYIGQFDAVYRDLAREHRLPLIPFLLVGVATRPELMQRDAMHPTSEGTQVVAETVMKKLEPLLAR